MRSLIQQMNDDESKSYQQTSTSEVCTSCNFISIICELVVYFPVFDIENVRHTRGGHQQSLAEGDRALWRRTVPEELGWAVTVVLYQLRSSSSSRSKSYA